jgi:hypothetical protein
LLKSTKVNAVIQEEYIKMSEHNHENNIAKRAINKIGAMFRKPSKSEPVLPNPSLGANANDKSKVIRSHWMGESSEDSEHDTDNEAMKEKTKKTITFQPPMVGMSNLSINSNASKTQSESVNTAASTGSRTATNGNSVASNLSNQSDGLTINVKATEKKNAHSASALNNAAAVTNDIPTISSAPPAAVKKRNLLPDGFNLQSPLASGLARRRAYSNQQRRSSESPDNLGPRPSPFSSNIDETRHPLRRLDRKDVDSESMNICGTRVGFQYITPNDL